MGWITGKHIVTANPKQYKTMFLFVIFCVMIFSGEVNETLDDKTAFFGDFLAVKESWILAMVIEQ